MRKRSLFMIVSFICICLLTSCGCEHDWGEADCVMAKTCAKCNATEVKKEET